MTSNRECMPILRTSDWVLSGKPSTQDPLHQRVNDRFANLHWSEFYKEPEREDLRSVTNNIILAFAILHPEQLMLLLPAVTGVPAGEFPPHPRSCEREEVVRAFNDYMSDRWEPCVVALADRYTVNQIYSVLISLDDYIEPADDFHAIVSALMAAGAKIYDRIYG